MSHFLAKWLKLSLVVVMGCGFLAMMIYALINRDEISTSQIEPPLITPPAEPLKRRPDQPGGMQIPNRDKLVFDLLDNSNTRVTGTDVPPVEEVSVTEAEVNPQAATPPVATTEPAPVQAEAGLVEAVPVKVEPVVAPVAVQPVKEVLKQEPKPEAVKVVEKPKEEAKPAPVAASKGGWGVQLAAVSSAADGKAFAEKMQKQFSVLAKLSPNIEAVPGGKGYRVQLLGVVSRDEAARICEALKGKQGCFPVSK